MIRCGSKNGHRKDITCFKEIGRRVLSKLIVLGSMVKHNLFWGGTYMTHLMCMSIFTLIVNKDNTYEL